MQIVIDKDSLINTFTVTLYAIIGGDYGQIKKCVTELFELDEIKYYELPKGHGRLGDLDALFDKTTFMDKDGNRIYDWGDVTCGEVQELIGEAPTIIGPDKENFNVNSEQK